MSEGHAPVAVVVVPWNAARHVTGCLESLRDADPPPGEIVVVDNASSDATTTLVCERFPDVRLVRLASNVGFCRAYNLGIAATSSPFVLVLNPDTALDPRFLAELLPAFDDPRVGIAAGKLHSFDSRPNGHDQSAEKPDLTLSFVRIRFKLKGTVLSTYCI